jgi:anti-sigma factor ChrR (cupin superfamily)
MSGATVETEAAPQLDDVPTYPRIELRDLMHLAEKPDQIPWRPFREGVEIHRLYGDGIVGPTAALLRFRVASKIPLHTHPGYEHIFVLAGTQRDQNGTISAGTLSISPPGTRHSVVSDAGCIVLAIYHEPVQFVCESTEAGG